MSDSYIQVPPDSTGKKVDTEQITVGAHTVERERNQMAGKSATEIAEVKNTDPLNNYHGVTVRLLNTVGPIRTTLSSSALAPGASVDLNAPFVASGKIGKLMQVRVASTVPCKWEIKTVDGAAETSVGVIVTDPLNLSDEWEPPDKRFDNVTHSSGDERFRVTATNIDGRNTADVYSTLYWDEV